jgi:D-alanyl-D-alanine carboxypeptidase
VRKRTFSLLFGTLLCVIVAGCGGSADVVSQAPTAPEPRQFSQRVQDLLDSEVQGVIDELGIQGLTAGVWVPGVGSWTRAYGLANRETGEPMAFDQHVRIGSVTKTFTVTLILQLVDEGVLSLDDTLDQFFPGYPNGDRITLRQLANMTSGLASYTFDQQFQDDLFADPQAPWIPEQLIEIGRVNTLAGCPFAPQYCFEPGQGWAYCNTNTVLLGMIAEQVTGLPYGELVRRRITEPLGLENTFQSTLTTLPEPFAHGYTTQGLENGEQDATFWTPTWGFAVGDIVSTFDDLRVYGRALGRGTLLSPETQAQRLTKVTLPPNTPERAYMLGIGFNNGWVGHGGELPGYNVCTYYRPDLDAVLVVIVNSDFVEVDGKAIHPAYVVADRIIEVAAQESPLGEFDPEVPFIDIQVSE